MDEFWAGMALLAGGLGLLILLAWVCDEAWKESIREIRDIWHEDNPPKRHRKNRKGGP